MKITLLLLVLGLVISSGLPALSVKDEAIFARNKALGRGINLGNVFETPRGQNWGMEYREQYLRVIKQAGFSSIRLPVRWPDYAGTTPPYTIEPEFLAKMDRVLSQAETLGLNVVLNIHHYEALDNQPEEELPRFLGLWTQLAEHYQKRSERLFFEICNEPHNKLDEGKWNDNLAKALKIIRTTNPTRPVIVGPAPWNGINGLPKLLLPKDDHLIVTVHYYGPFDFTHQGASWVHEKVRDLKNVQWKGTLEEKQAIQKDFDRVAKWAKENNKPVFPGEFGSISNAPMESRARWTETVVREAEKRGFSWAYWEFGAGFGAYDREKKVWKKQLLSALVHSKNKGK